MKVDLICGDNVAVLQTFKAKSIDIVVTSPPYNLNIKYDGYSDNLTPKQYKIKMRRLAKQLQRVMKDDGSIFINVAGSNTKPMPPFKLALWFSRYFVLQNHIVWIKSIAVKGITHRHYKPIPGTRFLNHTHETILHFTKQGKVALARLAVGIPYSDKTNIKRRNHAQDLKCAGNVWFEPSPTRNAKVNHPATFPQSLVLRCLKLHGKPKPIVLDPHSGSGTTLFAAKEFGAKQAIGIDISKKYIAVARKQLHG